MILICKKKLMLISLRCTNQLMVQKIVVFTNQAIKYFQKMMIYINMGTIKGKNGSDYVRGESPCTSSRALFRAIVFVYFFRLVVVRSYRFTFERFSR